MRDEKPLKIILLGNNRKKPLADFFLDKAPLVALVIGVILAFWHVFCGCSTPKKSIRAPVITSTEAVKPLVDGCTKLDELYWKCRANALSTVYDNIVNLEFDLMECEDHLTSAEKLCGLSIEERNWQIWDRDQKLSKWYRKWYLTIPIGTALGVIIGILAGG
jgi:hypothetical protein